MTITEVDTGIQTIGDMLTSSARYPPGTPVSRLADDFFRAPQLEAVAVVEDTRALGLITRQKFLFNVFRRFGWEVFGRKAITEVTDTKAVRIGRQTRLDAALARAVERAPEDVYDELIVTDEEGNYLGLLSVRQMIIQHSHALANVLAQKDIANARAKELAKVSEIKSQFLANVTHDLRSPVNAIIELTELIRMAAEKGYIAQIKDRLSLLLASATNLRSIITNILDLSKIEAGKMQVIADAFDLPALLTEVAATTRILLGDKPVDVVLDAEPEREWNTDPVKLRQIVLNLTSNAAKFTETGQIRIEQSCENERAIIRVTDTGIGIHPENLGIMFEPFSQLEDARFKRHEGTGLGLAITRELLDLLGGTIQVSSVFSQGSTFTITIPNYSGEEP